MNFAPLIRPPAQPPVQRPPLLVLLHGKGANEEDLFTLAGHFDPRFVVISLRAPHEMAPGYYRWYERKDSPQGSVFNEDEIEASRLFLMQAIDEAVIACDADPSQVFVLGFSQGASMALALALTMPHRLRGVVSIAGRLVPLALPHTMNAAALAVLLQHGQQDEVVAFAETVAASARFTALGIKQQLQEYQAGHTVTPNMLRDARRFLSAQLNAATQA